VHPAWGPYPDTVLHFPEAGLTVDLRRAISPHTRTALARLGLGGPFAVVTACNPLGRPGARLAHGEAASGTHLEPGWALPISLEEVRVLAARFFQLGIFWFDGDCFFIEPVLAAGPAVRLPVAGASV